jgi:hypothetical protein
VLALVPYASGVTQVMGPWITGLRHDLCGFLCRVDIQRFLLMQDGTGHPDYLLDGPVGGVLIWLAQR